MRARFSEKRATWNRVDHGAPGPRAEQAGQQHRVHRHDHGPAKASAPGSDCLPPVRIDRGVDPMLEAPGRSFRSTPTEDLSTVVQKSLRPAGGT
jgi:hypothetical protein